MPSLMSLKFMSHTYSNHSLILSSDSREKEREIEKKKEKRKRKKRGRRGGKKGSQKFIRTSVSFFTFPSVLFMILSFFQEGRTLSLHFSSLSLSLVSTLTFAHQRFLCSLPGTGKFHRHKLCNMRREGRRENVTFPVFGSSLSLLSFSLFLSLLFSFHFSHFFLFHFFLPLDPRAREVQSWNRSCYCSNFHS